MNAEKQTGPKFSLGRILSTPGALALLEETEQSASTYLRRHLRGDWGDLCDEDKQLNDEALTSGDRILSSYKIHGDGDNKLWIITEAKDEDGNRSATTCLLPSEY